MDLFILFIAGVTLEVIMQCCTLTALQGILGIDNLTIISINANKVPVSESRRLRLWGIGLAVLFRLVLLGILILLLPYLKLVLFSFHLGSFMSGEVTSLGLLMILGGGFIIYTGVKEVIEQIEIAKGHHEPGTESGQKTFKAALINIVIMNLLFSLDSILASLMFTENFLVMIVAIIAGGLIMVVLSDKLTPFLKENFEFATLGLAVVLLVGVLFIFDGFHMFHTEIGGWEIHKIPQIIFFTCVGYALILEVVQHYIKLWEMNGKKLTPILRGHFEWKTLLFSLVILMGVIYTMDVFHVYDTYHGAISVPLVSFITSLVFTAIIEFIQLKIKNIKNGTVQTVH